MSKTKALLTKLVVTSSVLLAAVFALHSTTYAATITVNSSADTQISGDSQCTLREALANAELNAEATGGDCVGGSAGTDTIVFSGPMTIQPTSNFNINSSVIIDGTSGGTNGTCSTKDLNVVIDGSLNAVSDGFFFSSAASSGSIIKGLVVQNMSLGGFSLLGNVTNVQIACNIIGLNQTGTAIASNGRGIYIQGGPLAFVVSNILIGGLNAGDGNVIAGNYSGIIITKANNIELYGNTVGLNRAGDAAFSSQYQAIAIQQSSNITIGNGTSAGRNVFSGSTFDQYSSTININGSSSAITFKGNYFGTDITGTNEIPSNNKHIEMCDTSPDCGPFSGTITNIQIGGTNAGDGNVFGPIATGSAIAVGQTNPSYITVVGNLFGVKPNGVDIFSTTAAMWMALNTADNVTIGDPSAPNIFSGNATNGIQIGNSSNVTVAGNKIGYLADGTTLTGLFVQRPLTVSSSTGAVTLGSPVLGGGNVISGTSTATSAAVTLYNAPNTELFNNRIGLSENNTKSNSLGYGLTVLISDDFTFGGTAANEGNRVAGFAKSGFVALLSRGVVKGNIIYDNGEAGVVHATTSMLAQDRDVVVLQNAIYNNGVGGIDLSYDSTGDFVPDTYVGIDANDYLDADTGPGELLNHPILISATQNGLDVDVTYMLDVPVSANPYRIEFFTNPSGLDASGFGQGEVFAGYVQADVTTSGPQIFTATINNATLTDGITATVTPCSDAGCTTFGSTSEFSNGITGSYGIDVGTTSDIQTYLANNGPYHIITANSSLGALVYADTLASVNETDRDGVTFDKTSYLPSDSMSVDVAVTHAGILDVWFDINNDGDFEDVDEYLVPNQSVSVGTTNILTTVPASVGSYTMRFRFTPAGSSAITSKGEALGGEVEDYTVTVAIPVTPAVGGGIVAVVKVCNDPKALNYTTMAGIGDVSTCRYATGVTPTVASKPTQTTDTHSPYIFRRTLKLGMKGEDVKKLQEYLNAQGFKINTTGGAGSPGKETTYFGLATKNALIKFQEANANLILKPAGLTKGTGFFGVKTMEVVNR